MIQKTHDNLRLRPSLEFEMVVHRRHAQDAFAGKPEGTHLHHHGHGFHDEDSSNDRPGELLAHDHRHSAQSRSQRQSPDITHEDLRGIAVEPEEAQPCASHGGANHHQFSGPCNEGDAQVIGKNRVAGNPGKQPQGCRRDRYRHDRQAIQAIGKIHRITAAYNHHTGEYGKQKTQRQVEILEVRNQH